MRTLKHKVRYLRTAGKGGVFSHDSTRITRQRRRLSHESSGITRQRQCLKPREHSKHKVKAVSQTTKAVESQSRGGRFSLERAEAAGRGLHVRRDCQGNRTADHSRRPEPSPFSARKGSESTGKAVKAQGRAVKAQVQGGRRGYRRRR